MFNDRLEYIVSWQSKYLYQKDLHVSFPSFVCMREHIQQVLYGESGIPFISLPGGGLIEFAVKDLKATDYKVELFLLLT